MVFAQVKWLHFGSRLALAKIALWSETLKENLSAQLLSLLSHPVMSVIDSPVVKCEEDPTPENQVHADAWIPMHLAESL